MSSTSSGDESPTRRRPYTHEEDLKILNYIVLNDAFSKVKGVSIWSDLEKKFMKKGSHRTWQSLKERYRKTIIINIDHYNIDEETKQKILAPYSVKEVQKPIPKKTGSRRTYTLDEDNTMAQYILHNRGKDIKGNVVWRNLEKSGLIEGRSWSSLRSRFLTYVLPYIGNFLPADDALTIRKRAEGDLSFVEHSSDEEFLRLHRKKQSRPGKRQLLPHNRGADVVTPQIDRSVPSTSRGLPWDGPSTSRGLPFTERDRQSTPPSKPFYSSALTDSDSDPSPTRKRMYTACESEEELPMCESEEEELSDTTVVRSMSTTRELSMSTTTANANTTLLADPNGCINGRVFQSVEMNPVVLLERCPVAEHLEKEGYSDSTLFDATTAEDVAEDRVEEGSSDSTYFNAATVDINDECSCPNSDSSEKGRADEELPCSNSCRAITKPDSSIFDATTVGVNDRACVDFHSSKNGRTNNESSNSCGTLTGPPVPLNVMTAEALLRAHTREPEDDWVSDFSLATKKVQVPLRFKRVPGVVKKPKHKLQQGDRMKSQPFQVERGTSESSKVDRSTSESSKVDRGTSESPKVDRGTSESPKVDRGTSESSKVDRGTSESSKVDRGTSESSKVDRGTSESSKVDRGTSKPAQVHLHMRQPAQGDLHISQPSQENLPTREPSQENLLTRERSQENLPTRERSQENLPTREQSQENLPTRDQSQENLPTRDQSQENLPTREQSEENLPKIDPSQENLPTREPSQENLPTREQSQEDLPTRVPSQGNLLSGEPSQGNLLSGEPSQENLPTREPSQENLPTREPSQENLPTRERSQENLPTRERSQENLPTRDQSQENLPTRDQSQENLPTREQSEENLPKRDPSQKKLPTREPSQSFEKEAPQLEAPLEGIDEERRSPRNVEGEELEPVEGDSPVEDMILYLPDTAENDSEPDTFVDPLNIVSSDYCVAVNECYIRLGMMTFPVIDLLD